MSKSENDQNIIMFDHHKESDTPPSTQQRKWLWDGTLLLAEEWQSMGM